MSFHHVDFDFSTPDNGIQMIDDLLIEKDLLLLPEIKIKNSMIKSGNSTIYYCIYSNWYKLDENVKLIYYQSVFYEY